MARQPRFNLPGQPQHVIQRGNNREPIFCQDDDYRYYLQKLEEGCKKHSCDLYAYVLMSNHIHLLLTPQTGKGIGQLMQMMGRYYVQYFNYNYQRTGTLWEGRYKATLIDFEQYLLSCIRYIELNPVRAGMVKHPRAYPWSSYSYNALGRPDPLITPHQLYTQLGGSDEERQAAYRSLFRSRLSKETLSEIRSATNKAWVLGNDRFKEQIEAQMGRQASPKQRGGDRKSERFKVSGRINRV